MHSYGCLLDESYSISMAPWHEHLMTQILASGYAVRALGWGDGLSMSVLSMTGWSALPWLFQPSDMAGGFHSHGGSPIARWFIMEKPMKMDGLELLPF